MTQRPPDIPDTFLNIAEAERGFEVSRRTLQRHIKAGEIPYRTSKNGSQEKYLDPSALTQKYKSRKSVDAGDKSRQNFEVTSHDAPNVTPISGEKIKALERENEVLREDKEELKQRLREEREEHHEREEWLKKKIDTQALLLEDKREKEVEKPSSDHWLVWALGGLTLIVGVTAMVAIYYLIQVGA